MRTTLNLDDVLTHAAKQLALETDRTLTRVIEDALRAELQRRRQARSSYELLWRPVSGHAKPGVDLTDRDALYELMEQDG